VQDAQPTDTDMLRKWLSEDPAGTLILTADMAAAVRIFREMPGCMPDLHIGTLPEDPRGFNALCICPRQGIIRGYRRIVMTGMPDEYPVGDVPEVYRLDERPGWFECLPDIEMMRNVWKALGRIFARPVSYHTLRQLAHLVCADTGMDSRAVTASILSVYDMGLVDLDLESKPIVIRKSEKKKADPESSAVWRTIGRWRML